jgi:hypothetical protein
MRRRRLTTALAILAAPLLLADAAGATCDTPMRGAQFTPGTWHAHGFDVMEGSDRLGVLAGTREMRFEVTFDPRGVVTDGWFAHVTWGANVAYDSSMGSEANWSVTGDLSGDVGSLELDGVFSMDVVVAQSWDDPISGRSGVGYESGNTGEREASFSFSPDAGDCNMATGTVEGNGMGASTRWIAARVGASPKLRDTYTRMFALAEESWTVRQGGVVDVDAVYYLTRDLIAINQALATMEHCRDSTAGRSPRSPFREFAASVLEELLFHVVTNAHDLTTEELVLLVTQGTQAAGIRVGTCDDGRDGDPLDIIARFDQELDRRLRAAWEAGNDYQLTLIATTAHQYGLRLTLATLAQIGVEL